MSDPFADYGKRATSTAPAALLGPLKRRADARLRYSEIADEIDACACAEDLEACLERLVPELAQFAAELQFLWLGSDAFPGLEKEIERARARVDDGLDFPRWEIAPSHAGILPA